MKRLGKIVVWLASVLVLNAGARANDGVLPNNPYAPIVVRNVFSLNPAPTNDPTATQAEPPPKITLNGIMSIFGRLQALYKVAGTARPGQPAKDESYILSEGQRQDEIEVVQIDEKNGLVTFNNHGIVQELPLVKANAPVVASTPSPAPVLGRPGPTQNITAPGGNISGRIPSRFGTRSSSSPGSTGNGSPYTSVPTRGGAYGQSGQQPQASQAVLEQAALLELQREKWKNTPQAAMIPPTVLTPQLTPPSPEGGTQQ